MMKMSLLAGLVLLMSAGHAFAAAYPEPSSGDFIMKDFRFKSGEALPELKIHYRTVGTPQRDATGRVRNAVLLLHGTGGSGESLLTDHFAGVLFGQGQVLDASAIFHHPAGRDRARTIEQAERRPARALSPLHLRRHGGGPVPAPYRKARGGPSAPGTRNFDGGNADLGLGREATRFHGRSHASRVPAGRDRRSQPHAEAHDHGFHSRRSRMEQRRV